MTYKKNSNFNKKYYASNYVPIFFYILMKLFTCYSLKIVYNAGYIVIESQIDLRLICYHGNSIFINILLVQYFCLWLTTFKCQNVLKVVYSKRFFLIIKKKTLNGFTLTTHGFDLKYCSYTHFKKFYHFKYTSHRNLVGNLKYCYSMCMSFSTFQCIHFKKYFILIYN